MCWTFVKERTSLRLTMKSKQEGTGDSSRGWELLPHDADVRVRGWGPTRDAAFEQAALALKAVVTDAEVDDLTAVEIECQATDIELLFVEWLNAIIYELATRQMLFGRFAPVIEGDRLKATIWGEPADQARHAPACEPKGATYTALRVAKNENGIWDATCVVDV